MDRRNSGGSNKIMRAADTLRQHYRCEHLAIEAEGSPTLLLPECKGTDSPLPGGLRALSRCIKNPLLLEAPLILRVALILWRYCGIFIELAPTHAGPYIVQ